MRKYPHILEDNIGKHEYSDHAQMAFISDKITLIEENYDRIRVRICHVVRDKLG